MADTRLLVPENLNINTGFFREVLPVRLFFLFSQFIQHFKQKQSMPPEEEIFIYQSESPSGGLIGLVYTLDQYFYFRR
ncbi:MAG: hypothetical protein CVU40_18945 [Chloroflexi bacterium HGW-Chloroflexi-2]|nr:MAG: hypothetical protein CVU40_18945 [Chloroflexi bacterium HGW-Chloroflexi-2]